MKVDATAPRGGSLFEAARKLVLTAETPEEEAFLRTVLNCYQLGGIITATPKKPYLPHKMRTRNVR